MVSSNTRILIAAAVILAIAAGMCVALDVRSEIRNATKSFKDITLTAKVLYGNQKELAKIGKDFPKSYEFKTTTVRYKAPDKMRVEGKLGMVSVAIIMNGKHKAYRVPALHISKKEDCSKDPHKLQGDLDIGIVTEQLWVDYVVKDTDVEKTPTGNVYRITVVRPGAVRKQVCWVDAKTCKLLKMEKYEADGSLKSRMIFSKHKEVAGIWVPTRVDVYNKDNKLAGTTEYQNIKVNTGIDDSVFKL